MSVFDIPKWTVFYNIVSAEDRKYVGTGWEFFDFETDASQAMLRLNRLGHCASMRPFFQSDREHMGAVHRI